MHARLAVALAACILCSSLSFATKILIPMDATGQKNHLKAYGVVYAALHDNIKVEWLLNYKGGSFGLDDDNRIEAICKQRGVSYSKLTNKAYTLIVKKITAPAFNGDVVRLTKAPRIAVYTPLNKKPWDDAVTLALAYAEIPFEKIYADEVLAGNLDQYDWLHLHHEDFTGQYGKFWAVYHNAPWYQDDKRIMEATASRNGFRKVAQMQLAVVKKISAFVASGGNLFAMCSATDTYDIALAAEGTDICDTAFDGDPITPGAQARLDFSKCFAFKDFTVSLNPYDYSHSNIDNTNYRHFSQSKDQFTLLNFPTKPDPVPAMLCQNHTKTIKGFMGQTTAFRKEVIKGGVLVMGECKKADSLGAPINEARYIHGEYGSGTWTFYGGHDPEDYRHLLGSPPTDLSLHPNSPGYRLILNNVLCPAARQKNMPAVVCCDSIVSGPRTSAGSPANLNTLMANSVKITTNPSSNELIIAVMDKDYATKNKAGRIIFTNTAGEQVINRPFNGEKIAIDLRSLDPGIYMIQVNGEYAGKVVKN